MAKLTFSIPEKISLINHPDFHKIWLQDRIEESPQIIELCELEIINREGKQIKSGRLDILLANFENNSRYEIEIQLFSTDENYIIRTIEYWD